MRIIIVGAGHNGLTAAFYLARAGLNPLVLEMGDMVGGGAVTGELHPGFRCPTLAHHTSIHGDAARDMDLARYGVEPLSPAVEAFAPAVDGPPIVIHHDETRTAAALRYASARDSEAFGAYRRAMRAVSGVVASLLAAPAPAVDEPDARDLWQLLRTARRVRSLDRADIYRLFRWIPMPVADLMDEWFETETLRALLAAPGLSGTMFAPRSAGSALVLLLQEANRLLAHPGTARVRGGPGALTAAVAEAARAAGAEIQLGARVERIVVEDGAATGVVVGGREVPAAAVVSAVDPKTTLLDLVGPPQLPPAVVERIRAYRASGTLAKVNLALAALPRFDTGPHPEPPEQLLSGRVHIGPHLDYLERAFDSVKYGEMSDEPWLDATIPSLLDATLAPADAHVMSVYVHCAPYRLRAADWRDGKATLLRRVLAVLDRFSPGFERLVVAAQVISPCDLAAQYGFHGGHMFHGELALDQLGVMRPMLGFARYEAPLRALYLCGAGTHPGGFMSGINGRLAAAEVRRRLRP